MKRRIIRKQISALIMAVVLFCTACGSKTETQIQEQNQGERSNQEEKITLVQAADYLFTAADDYNQDIEKEDLLEGMGDKAAKANRLQVLVMVSRAFGELPEPVGNKERLSWNEADLSEIPDWAGKDMENLKRGGFLAPSDFGIEESYSGTGLIMIPDTASSAPDYETDPEDKRQWREQTDDGKELPLENEEDRAGYGIAAPDGEEKDLNYPAGNPSQTPDQPQDAGMQDIGTEIQGKSDVWNTLVSRNELENYAKRVYSLFGSNRKDDFYANINKEDLDSMQIPEGQTMTGGSSTVAAETEEKVNQLILDIVNSGQEYEAGSSEQKIRDFYRSILAKGKEGFDITPLKPYFEKIDAVQTLGELRKVQTEMIQELGLVNNGLLPFTVSNSLKDPSKRVLDLRGGLMVMTLEDYADKESRAYQEYLKELTEQLLLCGESRENAGTLAEAIIELEYQRLFNGMTAEEAADLENYGNTITMEELDEMMPDAGISLLFTDLGFDSSMLIQCNDRKGLEVTGEYMRQEKLPLWKALVKLNLLQNNRELLLNNAAPEDALSAVSSYLTTEVGQVYVSKYFTEDSKTLMKEMTKQMVQTLKKRISQLDWMGEETKQEALKKLDSLTVLIGYPDQWPESRLTIQGPEAGGSYFSNLAAIGREMLRLEVQNQYVGEEEFGLPVYMVNAASNRQSNVLVFPAGILQAPFFDPEASYEENLGGIGTIIAHEITHTFDDDGAQYDASGAIRNWWTKEDKEHFHSLCKKVESFYHGAESAPGISISGKDTLSENIADIGGVACALEILSSKENADYDAFFRSYAKMRLTVSDRNTELELAASDEHSPKKLRVNKVLPHFQEFYATYGISPGDGMYVAPEDRIKIW